MWSRTKNNLELWNIHCSTILVPQGENLKVISIEVSVDKNTDRAEVKVNIEKVPSLVEKVQSLYTYTTSGITKKIEEQKKRRFQKELDDKKLIEEIIKNKAKETITED